MVPWTRVRRLSAGERLDSVRRKVAAQHFSRWPVVDVATGRPTGYLLVKDLLSLDPAQESGWTSLIRPLGAVSLQEDVQTVLQQMQREHSSLYLVEDGGAPIGLITMEDILEQVVGRIEDEYPRHQELILGDFLLSDRTVFDLQAATSEEAIAMLAQRIPLGLLPEGQDIAALAVARERELSTDVGLGVAIPHARCLGLSRPLLIFGRAAAPGIRFSAQSSEPVTLLFLLVTPLEKPELQVVLLGKLAGLAGNPEIRRRLMDAMAGEEVHQLLEESSRPA
jgi:mannitol/fructose-specific phosphotransferase system IIA component (Ntr-type)